MTPLPTHGHSFVRGDGLTKGQKFVKNQYRKRFVVRGNGSFPFDMLRYDSCWPATQHDTRMLNEWRMPNRTLRSVTLESASIHAPTFDRWASYCWEVET